MSNELIYMCPDYGNKDSIEIHKIDDQTWILCTCGSDTLVDG